jgi:hypothetical protein
LSTAIKIFHLNISDCFTQDQGVDEENSIQAFLIIILSFDQLLLLRMMEQMFICPNLQSKRIVGD